MAPHVDLIENRWSGGYQERVGVATVQGGRIEVKADSAHYRDLVQNALPELSSRPERFLAQLPRKFHSDYFFATEPHEDADCPFAHGTRVS